MLQDLAIYVVNQTPEFKMWFATLAVGVPMFSATAVAGYFFTRATEPRNVTGRSSEAIGLPATKRSISGRKVAIVYTAAALAIGLQAVWGYMEVLGFTDAEVIEAVKLARDEGRLLDQGRSATVRRFLWAVPGPGGRVFPWPLSIFASVCLIGYVIHLTRASRKSCPTR